MANIIEITVKGNNELKPALEQAVRDAKASGELAGDQFAKGVEDKIEDAIPPAVEDSFKKTKEPARKSGGDAAVAFTQALGGKLPARVSAIAAGGGLIGGTAFSSKFSEGVKVELTSAKLAAELGPALSDALAKTTEPAKQQGRYIGAAFSKELGAQVDKDQLGGLQAIVEGKGKLAGTGFSAKFSQSAKDGIQASAIVTALGPAGVEALAKAAGDRSGFNFTDAMGGRVRQSLPDAVEKPLEDSGKKGGEKAGKAAAQGISPLIKAAFVTAAAAGPAALLAGTATALVGIGALVQASNAGLAADYTKLGDDAADAITHATAPLVPSLRTAVDTLDEGIAQAEPKLAGLFSAAAPEAEALASGISDLANNALPGMTSGLRAVAPYSHELAVDLGKLGSGVGALFAGLGSGAQGGTQGLSALVDLASHLLGDIGQITGALASGLGPALRDIDVVAVPVAGALTAVVKAIPPGPIEAAAVATAALFAVFKAASLAGLVAEGATFVTFLRGEAIAATEATAATGMLAKAQTAAVASTGALSTATSAALGPYGLLAGALLIAQHEITKYTGVQLDPIGAINQWNAAEAAKTVYIGKGVDAIKAAADQIGTYEKGTHAAAMGTSELASALSMEATAVQQSAQQTAAKVLADLGAQDASNKLTIAMDGEIAAFQNASTQASAYDAVINATFGKYQSYADATATFTADLSNASKQLTHGRDAFNLNTTAGAANERILSQLFTDSKNRAEALLKETGNQDGANKALQQGVVQLDATAKKAGFTKSQIDALNLALTGTKNIKDIKVDVGADLSDVYGGVKSAIRWIDSTSATLPVNYGGPAHAGLAHGGVMPATAAVGGGRGGLTWMNEQGPELVRLPSGSTVFSNPDSQRMLSQAMAGGADGGALQVEWVGGQAGDEFLTWLRRNIRIRGGSVQTVLGH